MDTIQNKLISSLAKRKLIQILGRKKFFVVEVNVELFKFQIEIRQERERDLIISMGQVLWFGRVNQMDNQTTNDYIIII